MTPEGHRRYEARLVRNDTDQVLTLVRDVTEAARAEAALRFGPRLVVPNFVMPTPLGRYGLDDADDRGCWNDPL
jgi:hypothetical protein